LLDLPRAPCPAQSAEAMAGMRRLPFARMMDAPRLNTSRQTISLSVSLKDGDRHLGEITIRIAPDDALSVAAKEFISATAPLLSPEAVETVQTLAGETDFIPLERLTADTLETHFDTGLMSLSIAPQIAQRRRGLLHLGPPQRGPAPDSAQPARLSAYVNLRGAVDHVASAAKGDAGLRAPRLDIEAAVRAAGAVLETEATFDGDAGNSSTFDKGLTHGRFVRRGTRLVLDEPDDALRLQAGDIRPLFSGLQRGSDMLGVSIEHAPRKLRPGENIRPTGRSSFRIERPSTVQIRLNGLMIRQIRLLPGDYDLRDLPLRGGSNNVELVITDDVGDTRTIDFTSHYDSSLLAPDISEWAFSIGVLSAFDGAGLSYDTGQPALSGFYRMGLTSELTAEVNLQADSNAVMAGIGSLHATAYGFFATQAALSLHNEAGLGAALDLDWDLLRAFDWASGQTLLLSARLRTHTFATPGIIDPFEDHWMSLFATYTRPLARNIHATVHGRYSFGFDVPYNDVRLDEYGVGMTVSTSLSPTIGLGVSLSYSSEIGADSAAQPVADDVQMLVSMSWRPEVDSYVSAQQSVMDQTARITAGKTVGRGIGQWSTRVEAAHDETSSRTDLSAAVNYIGNRAILSVRHTASGDLLSDDLFAARFTDQRTTLRVDTALAFADGMVAMGHPVTGGFAILDLHDSLADKSLIIGRGEHVRAKSDFLGPALLNSVPVYADSQIGYDVADLPPGYDLGTGQFSIHAPYRAGYGLTIGSASSVSVYGTLLDESQNPVAMIIGTARPAEGDGPKVDIFTNGAGRFVAQGLSPGRWVIEIADDPPLIFAFEIPEDVIGLYQPGTLHPRTASAPPRE
jgi:outer membrane usher protein